MAAATYTGTACVENQPRFRATVLLIFFSGLKASAEPNALTHFLLHMRNLRLRLIFHVPAGWPGQRGGFQSHFLESALYQISQVTHERSQSNLQRHNS